MHNHYRNCTDPEILEVLHYLKSNPYVKLPLGTNVPHRIAETQWSDLEVFIVEKENHPAIMFKGYQIFFPKEYGEEDIKQALTTAMAEQHELSPHRYLCPGSFDVDIGDVAVLAGASDGIFALSLIDRVSMLYLFEPDTKWHAPLSLTFEPWKKKVEIVPSALGRMTGDNVETLDHFMRGKGAVNYIQADIEGAEMDLLIGAQQTILASNKIKMSICCYHLHGDQVRLKSLLESLGLSVRYSPGYFVMGLREPFLRRGVIYASKGL